MITYSDSACTTECSLFSVGATVYINGNITLSKTTSGVTVKIEIYNDADALQDTPLNTTYNFTADTAANIKTDINAGTAPNWVTAGTVGEYYAKLTVTKATGVNAATETEYFRTSAIPVISSQQLDAYTGTLNTTFTASCSATNMTSVDAVYVDINGKTWQLTTSNYSTYSKVISGSAIGTVTAGTVTFRAVNGSGSDSDNAASTLTITGATIDSTSTIENLTDFMLSMLRGGLTDPRASVRTNPHWITPEYPDYQERVEYPFIVVKTSTEFDDGYLGMTSLMQRQTVRFTLVVITKNNLIKEQLADDIVELLRMSKDTFTNAGLFNYKVVGTRNLDTDESRIQRKEMEITFDYIAE